MIRQAVLLVLCLASVGREATAQDSAYRATHVQEPGTQLMAIYIGATACQPCVWPPFKASMQQAFVLLAAHSATRSANFATVGVSLDDDKATGLAMLEPLSQFDEIMVGGGWMGHAAARYIWSDTTASGAIPLLIVIEREILKTPDYKYMGLSQYRVLRRLSGANEIMSWVKRGAPLETPTP